MQCKVCGNTDNNEVHIAKEMMFGIRDKHKYFQCSSCGCLQISQIPKNLSVYYPKNYYSYSGTDYPKGIKKCLLARRNYYAVTKKNYFGKLLSMKAPNNILKTLRLTRIDKNSTILDVGCGTGKLLYSLKIAGFNQLLGVDPFINGDIEYDNGLNILQRTLDEVDGKWDCIMMHHSFEHMANPLATLHAASARLKEGGICLIRIPTVSSWAWKKYGIHWFQIDAPRHFFLHSVKSMNILASKSGMQVDRVIYDSFAMQFWASEQYRQDIALVDERSYRISSKQSIFSARQIREYKKRSIELNEQNQGDQAAFYLSNTL